jgi:hypothetical protein
MNFKELPTLSEHELRIRTRNRERQIARLKREIDTMAPWLNERARLRLRKKLPLAGVRQIDSKA